MPRAKKHVNVVFIGHVDAGKSTISGHILFLNGIVDERTLEKYEREAKAKVCGLIQAQHCIAAMLLQYCSSQYAFAATLLARSYAGLFSSHTLHCTHRKLLHIHTVSSRLTPCRAARAGSMPGLLTPPTKKGPKAKHRSAGAAHSKPKLGLFPFWTRPGTSTSCLT